LCNAVLKQNPKSKHLIRWQNPARAEQWQAYSLAALITLLLHFAVFVLLPDDLFMKHPGVYKEEKETVEWILETIDPEVLRYVEANPEVAENEPDQTKNYSFRAQQAADENPESSRDTMPTVEGDEVSQKIVQGAVDQEVPVLFQRGVFTASRDSTKSPDASVEETTQTSLPRPPAPDFIRQNPEVEEGPGSGLEFSGPGQQVREEYSDIRQPIQLYRTDSDELPDRKVDDVSNRATEARPLPRKRPTLSPDLVYGPLMRSKGSVGRRGTLAIDATFSQFGEYEQQFYAAVQAGWYQEIDFYQPVDTSAHVIVQFRIRSDGIVDKVRILSSEAGEVATWICQLALTKRSPFRPWTSEMVQVFGKERTMRIIFSYL